MSRANFGWRTCACGRRFHALFLTHDQCRTCYWETSGDVDMALAEEAWRSGYSRGRDVGIDEGLAQASSRQSRDVITLDIVNAALALTHPDRHPPERFMEANGVTAALIAVREAMR